MSSMFRRFKGTTSGEKAKTAIALESGLVKSGYLTKRAKHSQSNWKKRYFVLNGHSLTYYRDINVVSNAQGDLLLTKDTTVELVDEPGRGPCFDVNTPFAVLRLEAGDGGERAQWMDAIQKVILKLHSATRGYLWRKVKMLTTTWANRFFVLHGDSITCHEDHMHTSKIEVAVKLAVGKVEMEEDEESLVLTFKKDGQEVLVVRAPEKEEYLTWSTAIKCILQATQKENSETENDPRALIEWSGNLDVRSEKRRAANWETGYFVLTPTTLRRFEDAKSKEGGRPAVEVFRISPQCCVFETNLRPHAFELVTSKKVVHLSGPTAQVSFDFMQTIRRLITQSQVTQGPLLDLALERFGRHDKGRLLDQDLYTVSFTRKKPLGLVLERSSEWAVVKLSNESETRVTQGSVLYFINDEPVTLLPYPDTIARLTKWKPPLVLGFRRSPSKQGWLMKQSRGRKSNVKNWKMRFFILEGGQLIYKESETGDVKGEIPLMGSAVSLLSHAETGQFFCFRVLSGITALVMCGSTVDEMNDWAATLYHASSMANGGGYLLNVERKRQAAMETTRQQEAAQANYDKEKAWLQAEAQAADVKMRAMTEAGAAAPSAEATATLAAPPATQEPTKDAGGMQAPARDPRTEDAMAAVSSTSSPASCVDPKDQEDAQHGDAAVVSPPSVVALQTPKGQGGVGGGGNADGSTPQVAAGEAEQHRGGLVVDEALASHQQASSGQQDNPEQKQEVAEEPGAEATTRRESGGEEETSEAGQGAQVKELGPELGASGVGEEPEPGEDADDTFGEQVPSELQMVITMQKRASIIVNELGDSDDDDVEDEEEVTPAGAEGVAAVEDRRPTSALETPPVEARESSRSLGAAEDKSSESRSEPPTSDAYHQAIDEMEVTDELLELCFRNLNDGDMEGTLNPMQLSIIVRLITSEHNLFTEMKWFSAFDTDGIGGVSMEEFKQGIRNLQSNGLAAGAGVTVPGVIDALKTYSASSSFAL